MLRHVEKIENILIWHDLTNKRWIVLMRFSKIVWDIQKLGLRVQLGWRFSCEISMLFHANLWCNPKTIAVYYHLFLVELRPQVSGSMISGWFIIEWYDMVRHPQLDSWGNVGIFRINLWIENDWNRFNMIQRYNSHISEYTLMTWANLTRNPSKNGPLGSVKHPPSLWLSLQATC